MSEPIPAGKRLDSWKAIATYLQRDVATVARWEKTLGLPVRRVAGGGRSVFADTAEIDEWLRTAKPSAEAPGAATLTPHTPAPMVPATSMRIQLLTSFVLVTAVALALVGLLTPLQPVPAVDLNIDVTTSGVTARNSAGVEQWRHDFPASYRTMISTMPFQLMGGANPGVYFATIARELRANNHMDGGVLTFLNLDGLPQRSFSFDDQVSFKGTSYGPPWAVTSFEVNEVDNRHRIALSAHHHMWDPGLVTILDEHWQRRGTFVHAGWIEQVRWFDERRLLIGGFSNAHNGGMIAMLDAAALDGQGPEPTGSPHFCENCGTNGALRMFVFPRTELNRVTASRFNRALITTWNEGLVAQTREVFSTDGDVTGIYEFSAGLDFVGAKFNERYWDMHKALEAEGRLSHTREHCPDRDGPRQIQMWEPATGWRTVQVARPSSLDAPH